MKRQSASKKSTSSLLPATDLATTDLATDRLLIAESPVSKIPMSKTMRKFLGQLAAAPTEALHNRRRRTPEFCHQYFDLCEAGALECDRSALEQPKLVLDPSGIAVVLAEKSGNRHLVNRSLGVLVHAHLAIEQKTEALVLLESYRSQAMGCCSLCKADWWRRYGDYLVEIRDGSGASQALNRCLRAIKNLDQAGRVGFVHGISHYFLGQRDTALEDEFRALERLDLSSPRGYFLDALAILAIFLRGATLEQDRWALQRLGRFKRRIQNIRDWTLVRIRLRWVEGQLLARLGDIPVAVQRLDGVRLYLLDQGPLRQAVAVTLDLCVIYSRHEYGENYRRVKSMISACRRQLSNDAVGEEAMLREGLDNLVEILDSSPEERIFDALVALRESFVVPVRGIIAERFSRSSIVLIS